MPRAKKDEKLPTGVKRLQSGRYLAWISVDGKQVSIGGGKSYATKTEARDARSLAMAQRDRGGYVDPAGPRTRFGDWCDQWLELRGGGNSKTASFLRSRIRPQWGQRRLGEITPMDVQKWMNAMVAEGLAPYTIHGVYSTFKRIMQDAVDHDLLVKTPCRTVTGKPKKKKVKKDVPLSPAQILWLQDNAPARYRAMIHLGAWAGLRIGECIALRWTDVDLEDGILHVQRSGRSDTTKNGESRLVKLAPVSVEVLRAHRRDFASETFVFTTEVKRVQLQYADFRRRVWLPLVKGLEVETVPTFHDLRHAHATLMIGGGLDVKVLAQRLGHHAPSFTLDVYGTPRADAHAVTVAAIEAAMGHEDKGETA